MLSMTHNAKIKKWLISITSLLSLATLGIGASFAIVSCSSSTEPPKQEVKPEPIPPKPEIPNLPTLGDAIEWLWNDNIAGPIQKYYENPINKNNEITIKLINSKKPFNDSVGFYKNEFESGNAFTRFKKIVSEGSMIGDNYFAIFNDEIGALIPGYELSPLYGPWGNPNDDNWPLLIQAQLKWTRDK